MIHTYLFVPGNDEKKLNKALQTNADVIVIDLEDSVGKEYKTEARNLIHKWLLQHHEPGKKIYLRMNHLHSPFGKADLQLIQEHEQFTGVIVSKVESEKDLPDASLFQTRTFTILPLIESALGVKNVTQILQANDLVDQIVFGVMDYCVDLEISYRPNHPLIEHAKYDLIVSARAVGKKPPIDTIFPYINDEIGLIKETKKALDLGMKSKMCIHPKQIDVVKAILTNTYEDADWAEKVKTAFEHAAERGMYVVNLDGEMIDQPIYLRALQILKQTNK